MIDTRVPVDADGPLEFCDLLDEFFILMLEVDVVIQYSSFQRRRPHRTYDRTPLAVMERKPDRGCRDQHETGYDEYTLAWAVGFYDEFHDVTLAVTRDVALFH